MTTRILAIALVTLSVGTEAIATDKITAYFRPLYAKFGRNSKTQIKIVSGPKNVKMRNGGVPGKQWVATSGKYRFKLTIEDGTGISRDRLVARIKKLPPTYMKACQTVSDKGEDGIAIYASLGGSRAHGGQGYINIVPYAGALVIAHEAGHTLEQVAKASDPRIPDMWKDAIQSDKMPLSDYADHSWAEDIAEFAQVYAVCVDGGPEHVAKLRKLSPKRSTLWERILAFGEKKSTTVDLGGGVKMDFILIPAGDFMIGSRESTEEVVNEFNLPEIFVQYLSNEHPRYRVRVTKPFYMGKYEVTQEQWKALMGSNPSFNKGTKHPVETVSWNDCQAFISKLNERFGKPGAQFALPSEAQWEYACRAGTSTRFSFGDDKKHLDQYAWSARTSGMKTHPVGLKNPNSWGLYDMHGNVEEWCADWYLSSYKQSRQKDPTGPTDGMSRVLRGGSFYCGTPDYFRCADRYQDHPEFRYYRYGLRVVRTLTP